MFKSLMSKEAAEVPCVAEKILKNNFSVLKEFKNCLNKLQPNFIVTVARGSSDHAATYAKYLFETKLGIITSSAAPSIISIYNAKLDLKRALIIAISQSGQSPDLHAMVNQARKQGALTVALVNNEESPLAKACQIVIPLWAGKEQAVAATKSYIASLITLAQITAFLADDSNLNTALQRLPESLKLALSCDWNDALAEYQNIQRTFVIGRGFSFPIAQEAALKFKETAILQAEAFSAAEVLHGPFTLVRQNRPFLLFTQNDATLSGVYELIKKMQHLKSRVIFAKHGDTPLPGDFKQSNTMVLPLPNGLNPVIDPILTIQAFYPFVAELALKRGFDPDKPENLKKVTETY